MESAPGSDPPDTITKAPMKAGRQTRTRGPLAPNPPSRGKMFARGLVRHCPWCGSGHLFHAYFKLDHHCPRCGLYWCQNQSGTLEEAMAWYREEAAKDAQP